MLLALMRPYGIVAAVLALASGVAAQPRALTPVGTQLSGGYSTTAAMKLVYGSYEGGCNSSVWTPAHPLNGEQHWPAKVRVRVLADSTYVDGGVARHMLITWARPESKDESAYTCHACGVVLGVVVFRQEGSGWRIESSALEMADIGAWGRPPDAKLQRLGVHSWGVAVEIGDMHQGEVEQSLWLYGPVHGSFAKWFGADLSDPNPAGKIDTAWCKAREGPLDVMCTWGRIDYGLVEVPGKQMYDVVRTDRSSVRPQRWRFNGTKYVAAR